MKQLISPQQIAYLRRCVEDILRDRPSATLDEIITYTEHRGFRTIDREMFAEWVQKNILDPREPPDDDGEEEDFPDRDDPY